MPGTLQGIARGEVADEGRETAQAHAPGVHVGNRVEPGVGLQQGCFGRLGLVPDEFRYPL